MLPGGEGILGPKWFARGHPASQEQGRRDPRLGPRPCRRGLCPGKLTIAAEPTGSSQPAQSF